MLDACHLYELLRYRSSEEPSSQSEEIGFINNSEDNHNSTNNLELRLADRLNHTDEELAALEEDKANENGEAIVHDRKRAQTKELIEKYFYQLTIGCGNTNCENVNCASNSNFEKLTPNHAAARAIKLYSEESKFCDDVNKKTILNINQLTHGLETVREDDELNSER